MSQMSTLFQNYQITNIKHLQWDKKEQEKLKIKCQGKLWEIKIYTWQIADNIHPQLEIFRRVRNLRKVIYYKIWEIEFESVETLQE